MNPDKDRKTESRPAGEPKPPGAVGQQQRQSGSGRQYGEGSYSGTRQYNEGVKEHMQHHDVEREARDAAPRNAAEEKEMEGAERFARSKSRGEGASPDGDAADPKAEEKS